MFLAEVFIYFQLRRNDEGYNAAYNYPQEEVEISQALLYVSRNHSRQHHAECHEGGGYGIMGCGVFALCEIYEIEHVGCESKAVSQLLDEYATVYEP